MRYLARMSMIGLVTLAATLFGDLTFEPMQADGPVRLLPTLGVATAEALPRDVARRTSRRTSRRVARRHSVAGCAPYRAYYNCGGVYYRPVVEGGATVYVVVNP